MKKKHFFPSFLFLLTIGQGIAQTSAYPGYDLAHQRLLVKVTGYFLFGINEGLIDMDSAMTLAAKGEGLPLSLWYDEAYNDGSSWPGKQQLEAGRPGAAAALLTHTPDTGRIRLLTAIGAWYLFRPGAKKTDLDTALYFLSKAKEDADILHNSRWQRIDLVFLGHCYSQRNDLQRSADAFERAEVLARAVQNNSILAHVLMDKAVCRSFFDPVRWSILDSAKQLFSASGDKIGEIEARTRIVENAFVKGEYESAEQQILQLISLTRTAGFRHLQYDYAVLAYIQQQTSGELKALDYALTAVQTMDSVKDYAFSDIFYLRVGNVYSFMGDEDAAYNWFSRSIYKKNKEGDRHWYINFIAAVNAYSVEGRVERAKQLLDSILPSYPPITLFEKLAITREQLLLASALGHFSDETRYSDELAAYCDQLSDIPQIRKDVAGGYAILSLSYAELHRPDPARFYLQKARQYPSQVISGAERLKLLKAIFILDSLAGNTHQAFRDYVFYRNVVDSFGDFRMHKQIRELGMKYDVARKEHELEVANSRNHLQQDALEKAAFQRRVAIAGLVMLLILLGLAINRYRIKKAKEKEITGKNLELQRLLKEKDLLVKEIYHRVKNNLQTIINLLESYEPHLTGTALEAIEASQNRVYAMSLIHQKLYKSSTQVSIPISVYLGELIGHLRESYQTANKIQFRVDIDPIELDVSQAIPLGLILNESVTNAIKYAFLQPSANNMITVILRDSGNLITFTITDNGTGSTPIKTGPEGLGLELLKGLTEDMHGRFFMENDNGTTITIQFQPYRFEVPGDSPP